MSTRPEHLPTHLPHYIDGRDVDSIGGETFEVLDPVTNETYAHRGGGAEGRRRRAPSPPRRRPSSPARGRG